MSKTTFTKKKEEKQHGEEEIFHYFRDTENHRRLHHSTLDRSA